MNNNDETEGWKISDTCPPADKMFIGVCQLVEPQAEILEQMKIRLI